MPTSSETSSQTRFEDTDGGTDGLAANGGEDSPSDTMGGRIGGSNWRVWLLLSADRWRVAAIFSVSIFAMIVLPSFLDVAPMRAVITNQTALWWVFSPLIGAVLTGVTLVVTFTQLVLSQELGPVGDQRSRMSGAIEFREDIESWLAVSPTPPDPSSFLEALVDSIEGHAEDLQTATEDLEDDVAREQVTDFTVALTEHAATVGEGLADATFGDFDVLHSALDFNYSLKIYEAKQLRQAHDADLDEESRKALDDIITVLEFFGPAREHFKTLYFQWELINLSRMMLYTALPALGATFLIQLYVSPSSFPGMYFGVSGLVWIVATGVTVALVPFFLLAAYVLRIGTIAKRTLAIGPFILRDTDRSEDIDWE